MKETVGINGLTLCHKHSDGWVRSTLPDVCKAPTVPVPFVNVAFAKDLAKGTKTVFSHSGAMNGIKGSEFSKSIGDEPGVGGGVKSGVNLHRATFLSWSPNVFMEGKPVTRLTDRMLLNKGNTISAGGYYTGPVNNAGNEELLEEFCKAACQCLAEGNMNQRCVGKKLKDWAKANSKNVHPEASYVKDANGNWTLRGTRPDGSLRTSRPKGSRAPDVTDLDNNSIVEGKLNNPNTGFRDDYGPGQDKAYNDIVNDEKNPITSREDVNFDDCDCEGKGRTKKQRAAEATQGSRAASLAAKALSIARFGAKRNPLGTIYELGKMLLPTPAY
jgi:Domain of unknown function (DUF4150)